MTTIPQHAPLTITEHLFFDLDGTLTDPREGIISCIQYALHHLARPIPSDDALLECIGPPLHLSFRALVGPELVDSAIELYRQRFRTAGMFENRVYPGVQRALAALRASGHALRVVTSKPTVFAAQIVQHFGLDEYFDAVHGSDLDGHLSDKTELLAFVLRATNTKALDATMLGDRSHDIVGAKNNGIQAAGALWGYGSRPELIAAGANHLYEDITSFADAMRPS